MNLFFDLDGTLIDSSLRLYNLFQDLVPQSRLTFDEYWQFKRDNFNHAKLLIHLFNLPGKEIDMFNSTWMELIESEDRLKLDKPFFGVSNYLNALKSKGYCLFIITARQYKLRALNQISGYGWLHIFRDILITEQKLDKSELIKPNLRFDNQNCIIGDAYQDILVGKDLKIKTVAVLSGVSSRKNLMEYCPDIIVNSVIDFMP